jgi:hypothetical protein
VFLTGLPINCQCCKSLRALIDGLAMEIGAPTSELYEDQDLERPGADVHAAAFESARAAVNRMDNAACM